MSGVAFVFPGQGAQHPGMGKALAEAFPESRAVFSEADEALESRLTRLCFEGSADELELTENAQPAILTVSIAALRAVETRGVRAVAAAGHSLGEYSAHVAAGSLTETLYQSQAGPITPLDIFYGHIASVARGEVYMAHKTGFSLQLLGQRLFEAGFRAVFGKQHSLELWFTAFNGDISDAEAREVFARYTDIPPP